MEYSTEQYLAINHATDITKRLTAITGPAGTGKTMIMKAVCEHYRNNGKRVALAALSGKAARRIREATGFKAVTLHKLLEYGRPTERDVKTGNPLLPSLPRKGVDNKLDYDVILVDEYAMVPQEIHGNLTGAMRPGSKLCAFGDSYQIPPIESYVLRDRNNKVLPSPFMGLIERKEITCHLSHVYRQTENSNILSNANLISQGKTPVVNKSLGDWYVKLTDSPIIELPKYINWMTNDHGANFKGLKAQVITCGNKSWVGTHALNQQLRTLLNPTPSVSMPLERHEWNSKMPVVVGLGDKVICIENYYDLRPYHERYVTIKNGRGHYSDFIDCPDNKTMLNGELGIIVAIDKGDTKAIEVDFGDRIVEIPATMEEYWPRKDKIVLKYPQKSMLLGYALTVYRAQGSEYDHVCYVLNKASKFSQSRENFYTAVTRARETCCIISDQLSIRYSVQVSKR